MASLGLPKVEISFKTLAGTAVIRSSRGKVALILNDENYTDSDGVTVFNIADASDIPATGITAKNVDLIKKALAGSPSQIFAYLIPPKTYEAEQEVETTTTVSSEVTVETTTQVMSDVTVESEVTVTDPDTGETSTVTSEVTVQSEVTVPTTTTVTSEVTVPTTTTVIDTVTATVTAGTAFKMLADVKVNYIAYPTGDAEGQESLASFVTGQRKNRGKTLKAVVANYAADSYSVINFTTGGIKIENSAYTEALEAAGGDASLVDESIPQYLTYTAADYTARVAGIAAGIALDRSMTYYVLPEVVDCAKYDDADAAIDAGQLILIDDKDGNGIKFARAINSYTNFTPSEGSDFRFIKIMEAIDLIKDDITADFRANYIGKVTNTYEHKLAYVETVNAYLNSLIAVGVLDGNGTNRVEIDADANKEYARSNGVTVDGLGTAQLLALKTGTHVFLKGTLSVANAMEDLKIDFIL